MCVLTITHLPYSQSNLVHLKVVSLVYFCSWYISMTYHENHIWHKVSGSHPQPSRQINSSSAGSKLTYIQTGSRHGSYPCNNSKSASICFSLPSSTPNIYLISGQSIISVNQKWDLEIICISHSQNVSTTSVPMLTSPYTLFVGLFPPLPLVQG